jgi:hypothetical protein
MYFLQYKPDDVGNAVSLAETYATNEAGLNALLTQVHAFVHQDMQTTIFF